jgi:hypothetical protein
MTDSRPRRSLAVVSGSIAVFTVGCGGSGSPATPPAAPAPPHVAFHGPGFTIGLPAKPQHISLTVPVGPHTIRLRLYFAKAGQVAFEVGDVRQQLGRGSLTKAMSISAGGTASRHATTYAGFPAIDTRIVGFQGKKATVFVREVDAPKRTLVLVYIVVGSDSGTPSPGYTAFVSSLQIR